MTEPLVRVKGVNKRFGDLEVLVDLTLDVAEGTTVAVLGPSGSGKSTLIRCINHLEPIQGGSITVNGTQIRSDGVYEGERRLSAREVARFRARIGVVFQSFNLFPHMSVLQNIIECPVGVLKQERKRSIARAMELLAQVNLEEKAKAYPATLSGGQQQRVAIIRALMMNPPLMLYDEPTSALDPELIGEVLAVIRNLALQGRTSIIVTHELGFAREVADKIVFMDHGRVIEQGTSREVLDSPREERTVAFIGKML